MSEKEKNIDESWKEAVEKERNSDPKNKDDFVPPEPDFNFFLSTLALQAAISMGDIPNPSNNQKEENLTQAKFIVDTLTMLKDKTIGNLSPEEDSLLDKLLYDLRMKYVSKVNTKS